MPTYRITLAYDGTDYVGWQRQAAGTSIQGLVEAAAAPLAGRDVTVTGAGRTDAGVHARGQVAAFSIDPPFPPDVIVRALNARLPPDIRVLDAAEVSASFHPRFDARRKTYRYRIFNAPVLDPFERRYVWHIPEPLDVDAMHDAASLLAGCHDFAAFQTGGGETDTTVRNLFGSTVARRGPVVEYEVIGDGFLRHMVRSIAGTLVDVGRRRRPAAWMADVLAGLDRRGAGRTAPSSGLVLVSVEYGRELAAER